MISITTIVYTNKYYNEANKKGVDCDKWVGKWTVRLGPDGQIANE